MRYSFLLLSFLLFCCFQTARSQDIECGMPEGDETAFEDLHYEGRYITSTGTLKVLVIFVRFADDYETSTIWTDPEILPTWGQNFVNTTYSPTGNYYSETISKYFYQNSYAYKHNKILN